MGAQMIVLGMHRSGTSAVTRVLSLMGAYLGEPAQLAFSDPSSFLPMNERGLWERFDVMLTNERLLQSAGSAWWDVRGLDARRLSPEAKRAFTESARAILAELDAHSPWVIKDPRLCVTFPLWRPLLRKPVCIFVVRNPVEIARSLQKRDGFELQHGIALWERHMRDALASTQGLPRISVDYELLLNDPRRQSEQLLGHLQTLGVEGLRMPEASAIDEFLAQSLRHQRSTAGELSQLLNGAQRRLFESELKGEAFAKRKS